MAMAVEIRYSGQSVVVQSPAQSVAVQGAAYGVEVTSAVMPGGIPYRGEYTIRPAPCEQVLQTEGKALSQNVVVEPIPSNWGLITWDGSKLKVS